MKYDDELQSGFGVYQAYPFYPFLPWEDEKTRDQRRFRELYPMLARRIQPGDNVTVGCKEGKITFQVKK